MPKADPIPRADAAFALQLRTFQNAIGQFSALLGLTPQQVANQAADADAFSYLLGGQNSIQASAQSWTTAKDLLRRGPDSGQPVAPIPPTLPAPPTAVLPGVEARFRALVRQIKANANYNVAIGHGLGIEGAQQSAPDLATVQPDFSATVSGGNVRLDWGWQGYSAFLDMIELQVDRGDGRGFVLLTYDNSPGYTDPAPLPSAPTKWIYRGMYRLNDQPVGQWSNLVNVVVGG